MTVPKHDTTGATAEPVALFDLARQQRPIRAGLEAGIARVLDHGQYVLGPEVAQLEAALAARAGAANAIAVSSGRDALSMALMALGVGAGDLVFVPAFTFAATAAAVVSVGAAPVFVDVQEATYNIDPAALARAVAATRGAGRPRAIIPVDLYGLPADYPAIAAIAEKHGLAVLADAAQSFGGALGGRPVGSLAPVTATSFYPTKTLGAYGDGGALFTDDPALADRLKAIRTHGRQGGGDEVLHIGMTGRLDTLQAAILLEKLKLFDAEIARRRAIAARYDAELPAGVGRAHAPSGFDSACGLYTIRVADRDRVRAALGAAGIGTGLFYDRPLHMHPAFAPWSPGAGTLPVAEALAASVLSLPVHPYLTDAEVGRVVAAVAEAIR